MRQDSTVRIVERNMSNSCKPPKPCFKREEDVGQYTRKNRTKNVSIRAYGMYIYTHIQMLSFMCLHIHAHVPAYSFIYFTMTRRLQYPLIKEYSLNHIRDPTIT